MTPPLARLTPQSRDSPRRDGRPNAYAARSRGTHPAATDSATRYSPYRRASSTLRSPLVSRPDPSPPTRTEPSRAQLCHPPTRPSTPALAQNTMDEEARLAADAHSTVRARVESLEARVEDQRRRLRESFDETERLRETRRSRRRGSLLLVRRTVFAKLIDMRGVDWSVEDARWMAEEWTRAARKLESYLE